MKPDTHLFAERLDEIKESSWIGNRAWWTKFVFHFSDIDNAINILRHQKICSRKIAIERDLMKNENASLEVLSNTEDKWKEYARFYFRPKTPTQYYNEGFKNEDMIQRDKVKAHCPVPIFFLFNSLAMLSKEESHFTNGNLARNPEIYSKGSEFKLMPFENIYHDDWRNFTEQITFNRHAELIIKNECDLVNLEYIVCRSQAEKETLINLIEGDNSGTIPKNKILVRPSLNMFYRKRFYIEKVTLAKNSIHFTFNKGEYPREIYRVRLELENIDTNELTTKTYEKFRVTSALRLNFKEERANYNFTVYIQDRIAFKGKFLNEEPLPF
ncbi:DarT ssDNA thymidine ADP-ribosyltransferase family protein [Rossellomorea marisflavi]|uniref:DarT ssDNA thymidine ADP-ribosyltransferase family protein n=1 Tax=Rossellomorea marisflavi TaxID=189381 RepID=UPI0011E65A6C|nr:DarT ssDNA thymidine ADP-ribosyltransferase family protein [Rossellomorea marisflavi]TYO69962.1 DUF4433 domain-containing protein [Rossellomorea marisflavi]